YKQIKNQLSPPWPADLIIKIKQGLELIQRHREITSQISAPYSGKVYHVNVEQLRDSWDKAEKSWWPLNRIRHNRIRSTMIKAIEGECAPELPSDLDRLITLRNLEAEITALSNLTQKTSKLWAGLETKTDLMEAALRFQSALSLAAAGQDWNQDDINAVAAGRGSDEMAVDLDRLRSLQSLGKDITQLDHLLEKTGSLWAGLSSRLEELEKALVFQQQLSSAMSRIATTAESLCSIKKPLEALLGVGNALLEPTGPITSAGKAYCDALENYRSAFENFSILMGYQRKQMTTKFMIHQSK
ncbi:MAG: hypothetical protein V1897_19410, partial [Pseudomonadota bacterium]